MSSTKHVTVTFISLFLIWRKYFVENVQYTDWHSPHLSSSSRTVRLINIKKSTPDITPYVLCFCFSLFRSASLMCSGTAMKNKSPFLGEMSVRNGFKKKRSMRRADSTYITVWLLCKLCVNYTDKGGRAGTGMDGVSAGQGGNCTWEIRAGNRTPWDKAGGWHVDRRQGPHRGRRDRDCRAEGGDVTAGQAGMALGMLLLRVGWAAIEKRRKTT